ncbi:MAG: DUF1573 domain-containing protein [Planctomycetes bacterium]|nr:DUF1573 domain-containing protein [Planctomycetota bacterium]
MLTKRLVVAFALLSLCPNNSLAQLRFAQSAVNLGELRGGPTYSHDFHFVNDSTVPIEIGDIRLGCGCLQPMLDERSFQPGEKGVLRMNLRTLGQAEGARTWQAHVQFRHAGKTLETSLTVGAVIRNEIPVSPAIIALTVETTLRQEITITDQRPKPMTVTAVVASSRAIRLVAKMERNGVTKITVEVSRSALTRHSQEEMLTVETDDPNYRQLQIPITLTKTERAEVRATPDRVVLAGSNSQLVRLRSTSGKVVRIEGADSDDSAIRCSWADGPGEDATLKISVDAAKTAADNATVRVRLASPAGSVIAIPVVLRKE